MESFDDVAYRISERCRDIINEELTRYIATLMIESGQRPVRTVAVPSKDVVPTLPVSKTSGKRTRGGSKNKDLLALLEEGPQLACDLEDKLGVTRQNLHTLIYQTKKELKGTFKTIQREPGNKNKGGVYAIRDVEKTTK